MHILPDAVASVPDHVADQFPMGYFFAALGFFSLFLLTRVVSPIIGGKDGHDHTACSTPGGCCAPPVLPQVMLPPMSICCTSLGPVVLVQLLWLLFPSVCANFACSQVMSSAAAAPQTAGVVKKHA